MHNCSYLAGPTAGRLWVRPEQMTGGACIYLLCLVLYSSPLHGPMCCHLYLVVRARPSVDALGHLALAKSSRYPVENRLGCIVLGAG